nr:protein CTLA-2-beta-like [Misgurnus anguillicaudatus]
MNPVDEEWETWKVTYGRNYNSPEEEAFRRAIWENKKIFIEAHNQQYEQGLSSFCLCLNDFADKTPEERMPRRPMPRRIRIRG